MRRLPDRVLLVTDRHQSRDQLGQLTAQLLAAGAPWVWLRDRDLPAGPRRRLALEIHETTRSAGAILTIGADVELAAALGAEGVHLATAQHVGFARDRLGPRSLIGVSCHSTGEVADAAEAGADYATLSPIFASPSKPGYGPALGPEAITRAAGLGVPVLALGGVSPDNAPSCIAAGAAGIAVMGAVMAAQRPAEAYRQLAEAARMGETTR